MSKIIYTNKGEEIIVDDKDFEWLNQWTWHTNTYGYAIRSQNKNYGYKKNESITFWMHREIIKSRKGYSTDHINSNRLDNRRSNLRECNQSQNTANSKLNIKNKSGYKGVSWSKKDKVWTANITVNYKHIYLGGFHVREEAARAYSVAAKKYFGEFARVA